MCELKINADDFAYDENRTLAIAAAFKLGFLTTTTVMANMPWFDRAMQIAKDQGFFDCVGLHLNFTSGIPLTDKMRQSRIFCNADGVFCKGHRKHLLHRFILPSFERKAVAEEATAQMQRYVDSGATLYHLDSHHHVHTDWSIASIVLPLAKKFGFQTVRRSADIDDVTTMKKIYKKLFNSYLSHFMQPNSDLFGAFGSLEKVIDVGYENKIVEVMTHPMFGCYSNMRMDGELMDTSVPIAGEIKFLRSHSDVLKIKGDAR